MSGPAKVPAKISDSCSTKARTQARSRALITHEREEFDLVARIGVFGIRAAQLFALGSSKKPR